MSTETRAWTLGYPPAYDEAIKIPGNGKAPAGYVFPSREAAVAYAASHPEAERYGPYEVILPGPYEQCTTRSYFDAAWARHLWHTEGDEFSAPREFMPECGGCLPQPHDPDHDLLLVVAPFVMPLEVSDVAP